MIRFNVIKMRPIKKILFVTLILLIALFLAVTTLAYVNNYFREKPLKSEDLLITKDYKVLQYIINTNIPIIKVANNKNTFDIKEDVFINRLERFFFGIDFTDYKTIIGSELNMFTVHKLDIISVLAEVSEKETQNNISENKVNSLQEKEDEREAVKNIKDKENDEGIKYNENVEEVTIKALNENSFVFDEGLYIKNETTKSVDIGQLLKEKIKIKFNNNKGPMVLIVHTHTSEAFCPSKENFYVESDPDRTEDNKYNVVRVGEELAKELEKEGIQVIQDKTCHDYPSYNGSYRKSLTTITDSIKEYPSICFVLDIHRDAFALPDGKKLKVTTTLEDIKVAQIMQVIGTNELGLEHNNWKENLKFALHLQKNISDKYPELARPINLRKERFNQHATYGSILIEIGSNGNTLEEALGSCKYLSKALAKTINQIKEGEI